MKSDLALKVATLQALFERWAVLDREVRDELMAATVQGERVAAVIPGTDVPVAFVTRTKPAKKSTALFVTDRDAFLRWCYLNRPDEVVQAPPPPPEVRSSFVAAVSKDGGCMTDASTGELIVPEGMEWVTPEPGRSHLMVKLEPEGAAAIEAAWAAGLLDIKSLPAGAE